MSIKRNLATLAIHGEHSKKGTSGPVVTPVYQSSTYVFPDSEAVEDYMIHGKQNHYIYARYGNPSESILNHRMAGIEGTEDAHFFASGMAAITTAVHNVVKSGDEIIAIPALYGQTLNFFTKFLPEQGINTNIVNIEELYDLKKTVTEKTKLIYFESPTNPNLQIVDIKLVAAQAKELGLTTIIDNTFATAINQRPVSMGIDIVVYSGTKYLGGHSDIMAGVIAGKKDFIKKCFDHRKLYGAVFDPHAAFLMLRSLKTLEIRVQRQNENAQKLAEYFTGHKKVKAVNYPGLPDNEFYETAKEQMTGFGGMVTIEVSGGREEAKKVVDNMEIGLNATSLGGVETLVSIPVITSHSWQSEKELEKARVTQSMIRISVGLENVDDIIADFAQALDVL